MSSGKDSTATACVALETEPRETLRFVFADTGNEDQIVYDYLDYLEERLGITITRLKRDFTEWWWRRRDFVAEKGAERGHPPSVIERVLTIFDLGPSGNPYLDLCMIKGRFPSRKAQFCTQFLKTEPLVDYQLDMIDAGDVVWSWQGVRADESESRRYLPSFAEVGGGLYIYRPILRWTAMDSIEAHGCLGIEPNPLYRMGMTRVGCMPCINCSKAELTQIARRFPQHIERIARWEELVASASWRQLSSFFLAPDDGRGKLRGRNIRAYTDWAKTSFGGRQYSMLALTDSLGCSSAYGLCE